MKIAIEINDREINSALAELNRVGTNLRPMLTDIGEALVESTKLRFRDSKAPDGSTWRPLSPVTIALRRKGSSRPLLDTGRLRNSITRSVTANSVVVGTNVIYAATQHFGASKGQFGKTRRDAPIPWGAIPGRPFFGMSTEDRYAVLSILRDRLSP